ncbi:hypothetical protein DFA_11989 [Cavenderia fasciculata]|uniref:Uncharacterized protein n=1 Tax=Cavenderia fasciculata TaxID=261658 RepID=F4QF66_CACFS|nr:uncharacterized protein DFA_11989 [Cavenderia fasciculata]EGG14220.1 hypothetical protein DFA_11989 [Cavenderia fasciculata]|eukprot:XP_004350928.1 hypothetical protein DFA_11989 [Cavenderia fasciculata]
MNAIELRNYIDQLFLYYYGKKGVDNHIDTILGFIVDGKMTCESAALYIESLSQQFPDYYILKNISPEHIKQKAQHQQQQSILTNNNHIQPQPVQQQFTPSSSSSTPASSSSSTPASTSSSTTTTIKSYYDYDTKQFNKEKIKNEMNMETSRIYVNELYTVYTGRLGDPASSNYLVTSLLDGSLSIQQAELHVKFSKESKVFAVQQRQKEEKRSKAQEYVFELYKVFFGPTYIPPPEDVMKYVRGIVDQASPDYQSIEEEIKEKAILNVNVPIKKPCFSELENAVASFSVTHIKHDKLAAIKRLQR